MQEWNNYRLQALDRALNMVLYPALVREFKSKLLEEAKEHVIRVSREEYVKKKVRIFFIVESYI